MNKKTPKWETLSVFKLRLGIYFAWVAVLVVYVVGFMVIARNGRFEISALEAAWTTGYMFMPILIAFGTFWFPRQEIKNSKSRLPKLPYASVVAITGTAIGLAIPMLFFFLFLAFGDFTLDTPTYGKSFEGRVATFFKILLLFGALPTSLVNLLFNNTVEMPPATK